MKRIQLFEFEDFNRLPGWLRTCMTNLIVILHKWLGVSDVLARLVAEVVQEKKVTTIVDLGSGAGGAMPEVIRILHEKHGLKEVTLTMTDLYPNLDALEKFNRPDKDFIRYHRNSVDATDMASAPAGLKTMVNSFHHMKPEQARKILESAQKNNQPLLIYEMAENNIPLVLWWLLLPLSLVLLIVMVFVMTPLVRPLTARQLVFTYLIPIIPLLYAWDGQASLPRLYTLTDMDELLAGLGSEHYQWRKGRAEGTNNRKLGTYLLGLPTNSNS